MSTSPTVIYGPISVSLHVDPVSSKRIIVFGDRHVRIENSECKNNIRVDNFIRQMALSEPEKEFVVVVEGVARQLYEESDNFLTDVITMEMTDNIMKAMVDIRKESTVYMEFYHFLDVCVGLSNATSLSESQATFNYDILRTMEEEFTSKYKFKNLKKFFCKPSSLPELFNPIHSAINDLQPQNSILADVVANYYLENLRNHSLGTESDFVELVDNILVEFEKGMEHFINTYLAENKLYIDTLYNKIAEYGMVFMDTLALAIMMNSDYKNVIVYTGEAHSRIYRSFLNEKTNFRQEFYNTSDTQCVQFG